VTFIRRVLLRSLPLAGLASAMCLLVYLAVQQAWRHGADDPQVQWARDIGASLWSGRAPDAVMPASAVDYGASLAPFVTIFNDAGAIVASSGTLHGARPALPAGVLDHVRQAGEERVTWQPAAGTRIAAVIVRYGGKPGGFVMAGRSLRESEERTATFGQLVWAAWGATMVGLIGLVAASEYGMRGGA
jgi:hypothetical protein